MTSPLSAFLSVFLSVARSTVRRPVALRLAVALLIAATLLAASVSPGSAQDRGTDRESLRVFIDCNARNCDRDYFRTEIAFVNWVRDRRDADVHVILTSESTGGGGQVYAFDFAGVGRFEGMDDALTTAASGTDTEAEVLEDLTRTLRLGLVRYAAAAGLGERLDVVYDPPEEGVEAAAGVADPEDDPWDFWSFALDGEAGIEGEQSQEEVAFDGRFSASRVTADWKIEMDATAEFERERFELSDSTTFVNETTDWATRGLVVHSLTPHWSLGGAASVQSTTFRNQDLAVRLAPALEWNYFPYREANRRQLIVLYQVGARWVEYQDTTLFGEIEEFLVDEAITVSYNQREEWGSARLSLVGSHFFHDLTKWRVSGGGRVDYRLFRGLSLTVNGEVAWIRDQLFLPLGGATDEEILVERRQLATDFEYDVGVGFRFQFGSIYNNVVNNRFPFSVRRFLF